MTDMTKSELAQAAAIEAVLAAGFVADGETRSETVRIPTERCPVLCRGKMGGEIATFGGRPRFALPGTNRRVTVGPRTVCFYRFEKGKDPTGFKSIDTKNLAAVVAACNQGETQT